MTDSQVSSRVSFGTVLGDQPFEEVVAAVEAELATEGFGVLSNIDLAATLAERLDEFHTPFTILGACNPSLASWAIRAEPTTGVLLPCNVVIRETPDGVVVDFMDPESVLELVDDPDVAEVAVEVKGRLERVLEALIARFED